jgi:hypothetical protein
MHSFGAQICAGDRKAIHRLSTYGTPYSSNGAGLQSTEHAAVPPPDDSVHSFEF